MRWLTEQVGLARGANRDACKEPASKCNASARGACRGGGRDGQMPAAGPLRQVLAGVLMTDAGRVPADARGACRGAGRCLQVPAYSQGCLQGWVAVPSFAPHTNDKHLACAPAQQR
jgi:hypothetical protein